MQGKRGRQGAAREARVSGWLNAVIDPEEAERKAAAAAPVIAFKIPVFPSGIEQFTPPSRCVPKEFWAQSASLPDTVLITGEALVDRLIGRDLGALTVEEVNASNETVLAAMEGDGLGRWIEAVRRHHDPTYQHCMLVNGIAAGFARQLGFCRNDALRFTLAAALHDVGKARVPLAILDKPGRLTEDEFAIITRHPLDAAEMLTDTQDVEAAVMDAVVHHHEYLDGSGYPHGLSGCHVEDMARLLTIVDIFAALIEQRAYKPPMDPAKAFEVLQTMATKLDRAFVHAFRSIPDLLHGLD